MFFDSFSLPAPVKPKSGDYHRLIRLNKQGVIAIVADGWGEAACDWKAAETAVEHLAKIFESAVDVNKSQLIAETFAAAQSVRNIYGICAGAKTSLCVLFVAENGSYLLINIGHIVVLVNNQNGEILEIETGQSDAILGEDLPNIEVVEGQGTKWAVLTSGILNHNDCHFFADISGLFNSKLPGIFFNDLKKNYKSGLKDDSTAVLIWV